MKELIATTETQMMKQLAICIQACDDWAARIVYETNRGAEVRTVSPIRFGNDGRLSAMCLNSLDLKPKWFVLDRIGSVERFPAHEVEVPVPIERQWLPEGHPRRFYVPSS